MTVENIKPLHCSRSEAEMLFPTINVDMHSLMDMQNSHDNFREISDFSQEFS